ncbi:MAG: reductive dehalogenase [Deltaproteobacteria bacterium]|nr:reductive dehalogenase [Deltaproteobacteria bacterium]
MKTVKEPTYKKYITKELKRFDDRNTAFSRGAAEGNKYSKMHQNCLKNLKSIKPGKTIIDHATWVAGATVDYVVRANLLGRETQPIYNNQYRLKNPNPIELTNIVKDKARWIGADEVGIAKINPAFIYTHWGNQNVNYSYAAEVGDPIEIHEECDTVIIMVHEMGYDVIQRSPGIEYDTDIEYSKGAWCASSLATFISELGYRAIPSVNELGINIAMAVDAGLGELGRNGQLITRDYGPRVRLSKVFTNLPLIPDKPIDIGVQKFCEECALCAKYCPSNSIPDGERTDEAWNEHNVPGLQKWPVRAMKCLDWWVKNGNHCSVCIRVCPWNKPNDWLHKFVRIFAEYNILTKQVIYFDQLLGYGKQVKQTHYAQDPEVELISNRELK